MPRNVQASNLSDVLKFGFPSNGDLSLEGAASLRLDKDDNLETFEPQNKLKKDENLEAPSLVRRISKTRLGWALFSLSNLNE